jgi:hypothetical protein
MLVSVNNNSSAMRYFSSTQMASGAGYESPFKDFFDMIESGRSSLGTTDNTPKPQERYLKCGVAESALRFKTKHFGRSQLAPHIQPGEHSVTLKVNMSDIQLTQVERDIVVQIVGNRVNEERNELRLASNQFGSRIENKRHLVSMLDRIILSAKRLAFELEQEAQEKEAVEEER